ncbi:adenosine deaminase, partial [Cellulomonas bogoriensis 69B4 = DSM 16987]
VPVTLHAGEAAGPGSIADALHKGGAVRLGHGVRIAEDVQGLDRAVAPAATEAPQLGALAHWVRDQAVPLEVCPSSNVQTGAATGIATHPVTALRRLGFAVTVNTDNRLMSATSLSREMHALVHEAGWTLADLRDVTLTAARSSFLHHDEREALVQEVLLPAYTLSNGRHRA